MKRRPASLRFHRRPTRRWSLFLLATAFACGCRNAAVERPGEINDAGVLFARETPKIEKAFKVRNTTGTAVNIKGEKHSCSCTTVEVRPQTLRPGDEILLPVSVHVPYSGSKEQVTVTLLTDHETWKEWDYSIRFESVAQSIFTPSSLNLGAVDLAEYANGAEGDVLHPVTAWFETCDWSDRAAPELSEIDATDGLIARLGSSAASARKEGALVYNKYEIRVGIDRQVPGKLGYNSGLVTVRLSDGKVESLKILWEFTSLVRASPSPISFGLVDSDGLPVRRECSIAATTGEAFTISEAESSDPAVTVSLPGEPSSDTGGNASHTVQLVFDPAGIRDAKRRAVRGSIRLRTNLTAQSEVSIPWTVFLRRRDEERLGGLSGAHESKEDAR